MADAQFIYPLFIYRQEGSEGVLRMRVVQIDPVSWSL